MENGRADCCSRGEVGSWDLVVGSWDWVVAGVGVGIVGWAQLPWPMRECGVGMWCSWVVGGLEEGGVDCRSAVVVGCWHVIFGRIVLRSTGDASEVRTGEMLSEVVVCWRKELGCRFDMVEMGLLVALGWERLGRER